MNRPIGENHQKPVSGLYRKWISGHCGSGLPVSQYPYGVHTPGRAHLVCCLPCEQQTKHLTSNRLCVIIITSWQIRSIQRR